MKQMESSNVIQKQTNGCLSAMQQFFLNIISQSNKELNPCYALVAVFKAGSSN